MEREEQSDSVIAGRFAQRLILVSQSITRTRSMEHPMDASAEPELFWERNFLGQQKHGAGEVSRLFYFQAVSVKARQPYELIFSGWVLICWASASRRLISRRSILRCGFVAVCSSVAAASSCRCTSAKPSLAMIE
jgi:hypothetical protein